MKGRCVLDSAASPVPVPDLAGRRHERSMRMPRYNFRWTNLPDAVLRGLCCDLDLGGDPAKTLRRRSVLGRPMPSFRQPGRDCATVRWLTSILAPRIELRFRLLRSGIPAPVPDRIPGRRPTLALAGCPAGSGGRGPR